MIDGRKCVEYRGVLQLLDLCSIPFFFVIILYCLIFSQGATSHHLGQNFSKMFDIVFEDPDPTKQVRLLVKVVFVAS